MASLLRGGLRDPRLSDLLVSEVRVTADLSLARIYVRSVGGGESERERLLDALDRAAGALRRELAARLRVRRVPELRFAWDEVPDEAARIERLLREIRSEEDGAGGDE